MKVGDIVMVTPSFALSSVKLDGLAGRFGVIISINKSSDGNIKGCWLKFDNAFENETEWYIPYSSIV